MKPTKHAPTMGSTLEPASVLLPRALSPLLLTTGLLLIGFLLVALPAHGVTFKNFSATVTLTPRGDGSLTLADVPVQTTNRIVVKAIAGAGKAELRRIDPRVTEVMELYLLVSGGYFAVSFLDPTDLDAILSRFAASPLILAAQPDLLQTHAKAGLPSKAPDPAEYIKRLRIDSLWQETMGRGVKIAIIDDGFDLSHEDLEGLTMTFGYDLESRSLDPSPQEAIDTHGTQVAGIIFARHNGRGGDGIAPAAELIAIRHPDTWTSRTLLSFYLARLAGADIINCSWKSRVRLAPIVDCLNDLTTTGRGGKGTAVVFAAGNNGAALDGSGGAPLLAGVITVGAAGKDGKPLAFSNYGPAVDLFACGQNILTTSRGPSRYTLFSGTSASAAIVSGTMALLLSRHPGLTLAELRQQLVPFFDRR